MAGFRNVAAWANAVDAGKTHVTTFRKTVASAATAANDFIDYTYFAGNPPANFYASAPLEAAYVESIRGIHVPTMNGTEKQYVKSITAMSLANSATSTSNQNQRHLLCDYLMYYPFIDTDAVGELQEMVPTVALPRYNTEAVFGPELVVNGTFDTDTSGWTPQQGAQLDVVDGQLRVTSTAANYAIAAQSLTGLKIGGRYKITWDGYKGPQNQPGWLIVTGVAQAPLNNLHLTQSIERYSIDVICTGGTINLSAQCNNVIGTETFFDNISVREIVSRGQGGQVMAVAQSASSTVGTFTMRYTNQDGISGRISQPTFTKVVAGGGTLVSSTTNSVAGSQPFVQLQTGDSGVRSIENVTFTAAGGGLLALVIVQPLIHFLTTQESRRTTTGSLDSYGAATYTEAVLMRQPVEIKNGAVLGSVALGNAGSLASSVLVGTLQTVWG